jgi:histidinol dehydrogenase
VLKTLKAGGRSARENIERIRTRLDIAAASMSFAARRASARVFGKALKPEDSVRRILADVRSLGDKALSKYSQAFDGCQLKTGKFKVNAAELRRAREFLDLDLRHAMLQAAKRIRLYQEHVALPESVLMRRPGEELGLRIIPMGRVGIYVPGGTAAYPSSVLMNVIPAQAAGVEEIVVCSPPDADGKVNSMVLAACAELGVSEVWKLGGAQAVAAMAYGTQSLKPVEMIAGPGSLYVTMAKQMVYGTVDLDMPAGPSEICVVADSSARAAEVAADLLSQVEHDALASCVLITSSRKLAREVDAQLKKQLGSLPRHKMAEQAITQWGLALIVDRIEDAAEIVNQVAPEHLEVICKRPERIVDKVRCAGTVFIGRFSPEPIGDYLAGPSHTLPTSGSARVFSGLSAASFCRSMATVKLSSKVFKQLGPLAALLARAEGLEAHARSVESRY